MKINDIVLGKIIDIEKQRAIVQVLSVNNTSVTPFDAFIKKEHMGNKNIDWIRVENIFEPGDIILGKIKSLSETKKVLISIEDDELGVLLSKTEENEFLKMENKNQMICPSTQKVYSKKVALLKTF